MKFSVRTVLSAAILLCAETSALPQSPRQKPQLAEIASGKTRVIDLSYALSDKLVPWPGDAKAFEAKVNATVEKNGYFTRSFWMLEHCGTHMNAQVGRRFWWPGTGVWVGGREVGTTQIQIA